jgi:hypothetical protein
MSSSKPALGALLLALCLPASAAEDLGALEVVGQRGQSLEQTRHDRSSPPQAFSAPAAG